MLFNFAQHHVSRGFVCAISARKQSCSLFLAGLPAQGARYNISSHGVDLGLHQPALMILQLTPFVSAEIPGRSSLGCWAQVGAVVVGFDRHINYHKIQYATLCISENPGCHFIATNLDAKTHLTDAQEWAGNGSMVGAIKGRSAGFCQ